MKITAISIQAKNKNRVNVMVDGAYRFSLDVFQVGDLSLKIGKEYSEAELTELEQESIFGKLYTRALEYTMMRPHSEKEIKDYLWRKTRTTRTKDGREKPGVSQAIADRVFDRLKSKSYVSDETFTRYWVENRSQVKGISRRKLQDELAAKDVPRVVVEAALASSPRDDREELAKIVQRKRRHYPDKQKLIAYLIRQGFSYDDIKSVLVAEGYE